MMALIPYEALPPAVGLFVFQKQPGYLEVYSRVASVAF
jgi:hypothetical protein